MEEPSATSSQMTPWQNQPTSSAGPSRPANSTEDWKTILDPARAARLYRETMLDIHASGKPLHLHVNLGDSISDQEMSFIAFYKARNVEWANAMQCRLEGDHAIGEGVNRYWFSRVMQKLKEGFNLNFGRLEGNSKLSAAEKESVNNLCLAWDLPVMSNDKRRWLFERLLYHAVIGRAMRQIKQIRKELTDTMLWPLINQRPDAAPIIFPQESSAVLTPEVNTSNKTASSDELKELVKFWVGWEAPSSTLTVECCLLLRAQQMACLRNSDPMVWIIRQATVLPVKMREAAEDLRQSVKPKPDVK
ncbi:hypothetical protein JOQ06_009530, partial [Pogonophryne albipinna]